ncbi:uncharacterized protein [Aegilops tauschii subsp. strangulata]|uniref:uncharacterized protein isoform X1 n=1 Tax=Aegilops tauschii subsp. strangulata TaxID=200361 RepID=UPI003CC86E3A
METSERPGSQDQNGEVAEGTDSDEEDDFDWAAGESSRSDWGEKYPASVGLYHVEPSEHDISKFYVGMEVVQALSSETSCGVWLGPEGRANSWWRADTESVDMHTKDAKREG